MTEHVLTGLAIIVVGGITAQWLAWRLKFPSILLLLLTGFLLGPALGIIQPDELFGDLLIPVVSLSVALILFEGGLSLKIDELHKVGAAVLNLISVGALITWFFGSVGAHFLLGLDWPLSILFASIIVVTGPTVTGPLLRQIRPKAKLNSVLKWEGIAIDPLGVMLAVLVFEVILAGELTGVTNIAISFILRTLAVGSVVGVVTAGLLVFLLRRFWIPDFLQSPVALMATIGAFTISDLVQAESGLLTVTVMGVVLANQKSVSVKHIVEFKENLRVLLISGLFILLAARLQLADLQHVGLAGIVFLAVLVLVARPAAAFISTWRQDFTLPERAFIAWMAPRGVVAAAMSSVFALSLAEAGYQQAERLVPLTFFVIIGTVAIYGLTAPLLARRLEVAQPNPQGVLIVGAHSWAREIAKILKREGLSVRLADANYQNISAARMAGLPTYFGNVLTEHALDEIELHGIGRLLALTGNDEVNSLAALHYSELFGRSEVYQLKTRHDESSDRTAFSRNLRGRLLFGRQETYAFLNQRIVDGASIKTTRLTAEFDYNAFLERYGQDAVPMFLITAHGDLQIFTEDQSLHPEEGQTLISLANPAPAPSAGDAAAMSQDALP